MKHLLILFIIIPFLNACEESESQTTELEGLWQTECIGPFSAFNSNSNQASHIISMLFESNNIEIKIKTFTDNQCTILESITPATESNNLFVDNKVPTSFVIGEAITASNGLPAKEIDFTLEDGEIQLSIYQLQDNNTSLFFGGPCIESPLVGSNPCVNERPIDIGLLKYIKQI